jgi:hypothetical protein
VAPSDTPLDGQHDDDGPGKVSGQLGPRLRAEFEQLQKSERNILAALAKPDTAKDFAADPLAVLTALKIDVPPIVRQRLKSAASSTAFSELARPRSFRLPNGQVVTTSVNLRFTGPPPPLTDGQG